MNLPRPVFVVDAVRTPIGRYGGRLATVRPDDLAAEVLKAIVQRTGLDPAEVGEVILGCANQAGEDNRNVARMATLLAGFPYEIPAHTVNRLCASGLDAVNAGRRIVALGEADVVLVGGVESMSRAPWSVAKPFTEPPRGNNTMYDTALGWRFPNAKLEARFPLEAMGETAENVVDRFKISREDQDAFAVASHHKATAAAREGRFASEMVTIQAPAGKGTIAVEADEGPRADSTVEALGKLRPAFRKDGTVTAGNSSTLNDGASCLLLASEAAVLRHGWQPLGRVVGSTQAGVDPRTMGLGPVPAVAALLARLGWTWNDVGLVELNEAFAAQALAVLQHWQFDPALVNVNGGAIALGHPLGCSGARIATTLLYEMKRRGVQGGLVALCVGVGQGVATGFERV